MAITKVVQIGAGGNLGPSVLEALLGAFEVTVLSRKSSTSTFPSGVKVATVSDEYPHAELVPIFKGQDAVVVTVAGAALAAQKHIIDAAIEAGVQRIIPCEFGSDTTDPENLRLVPIFQGKKDVIDYLKSKEGSSALSWTAVANSVFFDWALRIGFLKIDIPNKKAFVLDTGDETFPATTLATVGQAVVKVLQHPDETKNRFVYVEDFRVSANQVVAELEKATGSKFEVEKGDSEAFLNEAQAKYGTPAHVGGIYDSIYALIFRTGEWESKPGFANETLGLQTAGFEDTIRKVVAEVGGK